MKNLKDALRRVRKIESHYTRHHSPKLGQPSTTKTPFPWKKNKMSSWIHCGPESAGPSTVPTSPALCSLWDTRTPAITAPTATGSSWGPRLPAHPTPTNSCGNRLLAAPGSPQCELAPRTLVAQETRSSWQPPSNPGSRILTHPVTLLLPIKVLRLCN